MSSKHKTATIIKKTKSGNLAQDAWLTSGNFGSKDAVLVFRTSIVNEKDSVILSDKKSSSSLNSLPSNSYRPSLFFSGSSSRFSSNRTIEQQKMSKCKQNQSFCSGCFERDNGAQLSINEFGSMDFSENSTCDWVKSKKSRPTSCVLGTNRLHAEKSYCNDDQPFSKNMPASQLHISFKFIQTETKLLRKIFLRHGLTEEFGKERFSILWTGVHVKPDILRNLAPYQRVNHFPRSYELTRKDRLNKNIEAMQHLRGMKYFDIVPKSFLLPSQLKDLLRAHNKNRGPWIVKPLASSCGRGIFIVSSPDQIPQDEQVLVSKYIADPLCIDGHKCDLRLYVLVTSFDPLIIYLYKEGLVRLATVKYDRTAESFWNPCMHLCNYSINKYHSDYIKSNNMHDDDVGHKWTLSALLRHLKSQGCNTRSLMLNIEDLIIKSLLSCAQSVISACRMFVPNGNNCFELYGFDILIDDNLRPWLLEINLSPSMGVDSPLDTKVKACLLTDLLTCVGIPATSPAMRSFYDTKWTRFRNISYIRRYDSPEPYKKIFSVSETRTIKRNPSATLTLEERKITRNFRLQNARRGGFVLIFPSNDSMQRFGVCLDTSTGIPLSTPVIKGNHSFSSTQSHNYNQLLYENFYGNRSIENSLDQRILEYESALLSCSAIDFGKKERNTQITEAGKVIREQIQKLMEAGCELTILQARQAFSFYLESVLQRLVEEPKDYQEKLLLKFLQRVGGESTVPSFFHFSQSLHNVNKVRSAAVAKLMCEFLELYNRETKTYIDTLDHCGMIPRALFIEFLAHAQESELESVLTLHTNITGSMPYLHNRFAISVPPTPPIPSGLYGFLRALPSMAAAPNSKIISRPSKIM